MLRQARRRLIDASPTNQAALKRIESAMIIVALDNSRPTNREDLSWGAWVGDGRNRWYDKHQRMCFPCKRAVVFAHFVPQSSSGITVALDSLESTPVWMVLRLCA
jgi:Choline/Carnitine o-acyltransferase